MNKKPNYFQFFIVLVLFAFMAFGYLNSKKETRVNKISNSNKAEFIEVDSFHPEKTRNSK